MLIHFEIEYCLTGQLITINGWSIHSQMIEKVGQIGLTAFLIKFRFGARSQKNSWLEQINNNPLPHWRRSESDETQKKFLPEHCHHSLSRRWADIHRQWQCR